MGIIFAQVVLFMFYMGSIVFYFMFYTEFSIAYVLGCGILGWIYGENFSQTLYVKSLDWRDAKEFFRRWF